MDGWLGFKDRIPFWFSYSENEKLIQASAESSGLQFVANMDLKEWLQWKSEIKIIAYEILGIKVGEIEEGEVGHEI